MIISLVKVTDFQLSTGPEMARFAFAKTSCIHSSSFSLSQSTCQVRKSRIYWYPYLYIVRVDTQFLAVSRSGHGSHAVTVCMTHINKTTSIILKKTGEHCTFLKWAKSGTGLAIGTSEGRLAMYESGTGRTIPILDKHTKVSVSFVFFISFALNI